MDGLDWIGQSISQCFRMGMNRVGLVRVGCTEGIVLIGRSFFIDLLGG